MAAPPSHAPLGLGGRTTESGGVKALNFGSRKCSVCSDTRAATRRPTMASNSIKLLTGNSHPQLAELVAKRYAFPLPRALTMKEGSSGE